MNEQIHFTGQYLANKSVHAQLLRTEDKERFLKEKSDDGKLPSMKQYGDYQKELYTVRSNIDNILGQTLSRQAQKQKEQEI